MLGLLLLFGVQAGAAVVVDSQVSAKYSGLAYNRATGTYDSVASLTNVSANPVNAPLSLVITGISNPKVSLTNAVSTTTEGNSYLDIPTGTALAVGQTVKVVLKFSNSSSTSFNFNASVMQGALQTAGQVINLTVLAADPYLPSRTLHYSWKVSEGSIANLDSSSTSWTLPPGPGVHFANVQVSNRLGGYTEKRIAVISDDLGMPAKSYPTQDFSPAANPGLVDQADSVWIAAPSPNYDGFNYEFGRAVYLPDYRETRTNTLGQSYQFLSDLNGRISFINDGHSGRTCCSDIGDDTGGHPHTHVLQSNSGPIDTFDQYAVGSVALKDGSVCGTDNKFHGVQSSAQAVLLSLSKQPLGSPVRVNSYGDYALPWNPLAWFVKIQCETALPVIVPVDRVSLVAEKAVFLGTGQPAVSNIVATLNGQSLGDKAVFFPPETGAAASVPRSDQFLAAKGLDSRQSACEYYRLTGAVKSCDAAGNPSGAITFDDWKRKVGMAPYTHSGATEYSATFINRADLNLTRNHHAITYVNNGGDITAAYVCNHLGPGSDAQIHIDAALQTKIDAAIDNAVNGKNLVACVAQDYGHELAPHLEEQFINGQWTQVQVNTPYVRYYAFAPNGQLLMSLNLDGRREKFMPGTCVACHGGDKYSGQFPADGHGSPDYAGFFLPYDVNNFAFSSKPGLTKDDQQEAIYHLNKTVQTGHVSQVASDLIDGWYSAYQPGVNSPIFASHFVPAGWRDIPPEYTNGVDPVKFYQIVEAPYCRSCHVAIRTNVESSYWYDWLAAKDMVCGGTKFLHRNHSMPNSLVTFNRMWNDPDAIQQLKLWSGDGNCQDNTDPKLN